MRTTRAVIRERQPVAHDDIRAQRRPGTGADVTHVQLARPGVGGFCEDPQRAGEAHTRSGSALEPRLDGQREATIAVRVTKPRLLNAGVRFVGREAGRYLRRQAELAKAAESCPVFQLTSTDVEASLAV